MPDVFGKQSSAFVHVFRSEDMKCRTSPGIIICNKRRLIKHNMLCAVCLQITGDAVIHFIT